MSHRSITDVDGEQVAGDVFTGLSTTEHEDATIDVLRLPVHVTYLSQNTLIVVDGTATWAVTYTTIKQLTIRTTHKNKRPQR